MKFDSVNTNVAWCPGCGDFAILKALKMALEDLKIEPKDVVLVSGIGQASKTPQYLECNYFNGLHGRPLPVATAIKSSNPNLHVIVVAGDGDLYGEGGNHLIHAIRRNPNITVIANNNMIYGLTKGQASPTSQKGMKTKLQTKGVFLEPFNPISFGVSQNISFIARAYSGDIERTCELIKDAIKHRGFSLIDIFQPCVTFNKLNTYDWFKQNTYYLTRKHDYNDRLQAFEKSIEEMPFPLGIFYVNDRKTFGDFLDIEKPLYKYKLNSKRFNKILESRREF